jgi:hypothetical protein
VDKVTRGAGSGPFGGAFVLVSGNDASPLSYWAPCGWALLGLAGGSFWMSCPATSLLRSLLALHISCNYYNIIILVNLY